VPRSAPKVRAFCKNLLRKKMAPQNSRAKVCGVEAPQGGEANIPRLGPRPYQYFWWGHFHLACYKACCPDIRDILQ